MSCPICLDDEVEAADATAAGDCRHQFCTTCLYGHLRVAVGEQRRYPPVCPSPDCAAPMPFATAVAVVTAAGDAGLRSTLETLHIQATCMGRMAYCANPACAVPFDFELGGGGAGGPAGGPAGGAGGAGGAGPAGPAGAAAPADHSDDDGGNEGAGAPARAGAPPPLIRPPTVEDGNDAYYKVQCPLCRTHTCVRCATAWHDDTTCLIAQAATTDKDGSAALRALAASESWRPCPRCGQMIEKTDGCAYVHHAACGAGFCFHCGAEYQQQQGHGRGRARTPHGTPECDCGLFGERAPGRRGAAGGAAGPRRPLRRAAYAGGIAGVGRAHALAARVAAENAQDAAAQARQARFRMVQELAAARYARAEQAIRQAQRQGLRAAASALPLARAGGGGGAAAAAAAPQDADADWLHLMAAADEGAAAAAAAAGMLVPGAVPVQRHGGWWYGMMGEGALALPAGLPRAPPPLWMLPPLPLRGLGQEPPAAPPPAGAAAHGGRRRLASRAGRLDLAGLAAATHGGGGGAGPSVARQVAACLVAPHPCPYGDACALAPLSSLRAVEGHLESTAAHDVFVCCGRPFGSAAALARHVDRGEAPTDRKSVV